MLSGLRRYTPALTGDRRTGDWYTCVALETLLQEPFRVRANGKMTFQIYKLMGEVLSADSVVSDVSEVRGEGSGIAVGYSVY